jgi:hypothetical protein
VLAVGPLQHAVAEVAGKGKSRLRRHRVTNDRAIDSIWRTEW